MGVEPVGAGRPGCTSITPQPPVVVVDRVMVTTLPADRRICDGASYRDPLGTDPLGTDRSGEARARSAQRTGNWPRNRFRN